MTRVGLVKGYSEALHPNPFVWSVPELVRYFVRDLVHLLDHSSVLQIETNAFPELDFQQQGSGL